jgi:hypothetical protein
MAGLVVLYEVLTVGVVGVIALLASAGLLLLERRRVLARKVAFATTGFVAGFFSAQFIGTLMVLVVGSAAQRVAHSLRWVEASDLIPMVALVTICILSGGSGVLGILLGWQIATSQRSVKR